MSRRPPEYVHPPVKQSADPGSGRHRRETIGNLMDSLLFLAAALATVMLGWLLARHGLRLDWWVIVYLLALYAVTAYLALPRLHLALTSIYVPHYFIGRTRTGDGLLGDPVNLAVDGEEAQIHAAMRRAGWTMADEISLGSSLRIVAGSVLGRSYPAAPVSSLYLFGRKQDFAYQMEVAGNPAQRHHVRFWECPPGWLLPGGERVGWLAAGTYDRAVGLSLFTLQVTHKIDSDIDIERDFIIDTVRYASEQAEVRVLENFSTGYHSRNGGGDSVRTDGDLPVLQLQAIEADEEAVEVAAATLDPFEHARESMRRRPASLVIGVALTLVLLVWGIVDYFVQGDVVLGSDELSQAEVAQVMQVLGVLLFGLSLANLLLAWLTFKGWPGARRWLTGLLAITVFLSLQSLLTDQSQVGYAGALIQTTVGVLTIYALTSPSARDWTLAERAHKKQKKLSGR